MDRMIRKLFSFVLILTILLPALWIPQDVIRAEASETGLPVQVSEEPLYSPFYDGSSEPEEGISAFVLEEDPEVPICESEEALVAAVREQLKLHSNSFSITAYLDENYYDGMAKELLKQAMAHTGVPNEGDYLLWGWSSVSQLNCDYDPEPVVYNGRSCYRLTFSYRVNYYTTYEEEQETEALFEEIASSLHPEDLTELEKVRAVYDYACQNITYDSFGTSSQRYTAYAALKKGTAVCQGYALVVYHLLLQLGVDVRLIAGTGKYMNHAWNIIRLGDLYYYGDTTWDSSEDPYRWYLLGEDQMTDHRRFTATGIYPDYTSEAFYEAYPMSRRNYGAEEESEPQIEPPAATRILSGVPKNTGINIKWAAVPEADGYMVQRLDGENWTTIKYTTGLHYTTTKVSHLKRQEYRVITYRNTENGRVQGKPSPVRAFCYLSVPKVNLSETAARGAIRIGWERLSGVTGYEVLYWRGKDVKLLKIVGASKVRKVITGLNPRSCYGYKVRSYKILEGTRYYSAWSGIRYQRAGR